MSGRHVVPARSHALRLLAVGAATVALHGCKTGQGGDGGGGSPPPVTADAIVVHDISPDIAKVFTFKAVVDQILFTAGQDRNDENRVALVKSMIDSFDKDSFTNPDSGLPMKVDKRAKEFALKPLELLDNDSPNGLIPIGFFNRMDLASETWSDCGEHRIVFATKPSAGSDVRRFFLIFEARLPNPSANPEPDPDPVKAMKGCEAVAKEWRAIGADTNAKSRAARLKKLYFDGLPGGFVPVVHHLNYGAQLGQVRANLFSGFTKWQLREFRVLANPSSGKLEFAPGPVASNPLAEFYMDNPVGSAAEQAERTRFQQAFVAKYADHLRDVDEKAPANMSDAVFKQRLFNCMGARIIQADNEFQSDSQGQLDVPFELRGQTFRTKIVEWNSTPTGRKVTSEELFHRAGAITCGGCHQFSTGKALGSTSGGALNWPAAGPEPFIHVSENKGPDGKQVLSTALTQDFIPHRRQVLEFILAGKLPGQLCFKGDSAVAAATFSSADVGAVGRAKADALTRQILQTGAGASAASSMAASNELKALSDRAHAIDQQTPGAVTPFRRPH
ncbi:MAG: hypothetical protein AB1942_25285 [Pseudomonadota bacterium]